MKKVKLLALLLVSVFLVTGCDLLPFNQSKEANGKVLEKPAKGNCNVFDCIKKLDTKDNLEKVNKVMGFEGEKEREGSGYTTYKWVIDETKEESVEATFYTSSTSITIKFKDDAIKNSKVDFSDYQSIKTAMNNRETVKYDDFKAKFKTDGVLIEKTSTSNKYRWVNSEGRYLNATFSNSTGACSMVIGRI